VDWLAYSRLWQSQLGKGWMDGWVKKPSLLKTLKKAKFSYISSQKRE